MQWQTQLWYMHTIRGTHVHSVCTCIYTACTRRCNMHTCFNQLTQMVGRVQLIPLFLAGNLTPTIFQQYSQPKRSGFPASVGSCDTAAADGQRHSGSNAHEANQWLWQFECGKPRLDGLSVEKTGARKEAAQKERLLRDADTWLCSKADLMGNEVWL